jgi:hypothetical protein
VIYEIRHEFPAIPRAGSGPRPTCRSGAGLAEKADAKGGW